MFRYTVLAEGPQNIVPFLYKVHYSLALDEWGLWVFGIAALIWTLDCFIGFYLTLPIRKKVKTAHLVQAPSRRSRWRPAWAIRKKARGHKLAFDLHRASGLWLRPLLLVFAWSGVGLTLPAVYNAVMKALGSTYYYAPPPLSAPLASWGRARRRKTRGRTRYPTPAE